MHNLEIRGRQVLLDGNKVQDVISYELKDSAGGTAELILRLYVEVDKVDFRSNQGGIANTDTLAVAGDTPEVIAPLAKLEELLLDKCYYGMKHLTREDFEKKEEEARMRAIVREEIAAIREEERRLVERALNNPSGISGNSITITATGAKSEE